MWEMFKMGPYTALKGDRAGRRFAAPQTLHLPPCAGMLALVRGAVRTVAQSDRTWDFQRSKSAACAPQEYIHSRAN